MALSSKNFNVFFGRPVARFVRRTYAEPGWVAIFAPGSEVESDQRSRVVLPPNFCRTWVGWSGGLLERVSECLAD